MFSCWFGSKYSQPLTALRNDDCAWFCCPPPPPTHIHTLTPGSGTTQSDRSIYSSAMRVPFLHTVYYWWAYFFFIPSSYPILTPPPIPTNANFFPRKILRVPSHRLTINIKQVRSSIRNYAVLWRHPVRISAWDIQYGLRVLPNPSTPWRWNSMFIRWYLPIKPG